ncbi:MAG: AMP-binding protein [Bacteroidales bacterium]|nr:AMP-binding protein [Bacteroidales bacterium]
MSFLNEILNTLQISILTNRNRNSFCINEKFYTYSDLAATVSKVRFSLSKAEVTGKSIGLMVNDDIETYASIIAVWLEGAAYVPLHPNQPVERSNEIVSQAGVSFVLDSRKMYRHGSVQRIEIGEEIPEEIDLTPHFVTDDTLAYILFTSGSTGKPKGVQITRRNLAAFMKSFWETGISLKESDRCLQCFDLTFDV